MPDRLAAACSLALLLLPHGIAAQATWVPLDWRDSDDRTQVIEYDRGALQRGAGVLTVALRRDRESALRQAPAMVAGDHPWTRQVVEIDCPAENWRVARWEARDETGQLLDSGGGEGWQPIRSHGYPRALAWRLCPWP